MVTRLMEVLFSNTDEQIAEQVDNDIKAAKENGVVDTDELKYEKVEDGVAITDKETGEVTLAQDSDEADTYDLVAVPDGELERFLHPSEDGVSEGTQVGAPDEQFADHADEEAKKEPEKAIDICPACGESPCVCEDAPVEEAGAEKEFSVKSNNSAWNGIFSYPQEFAERLFSDVIESEESAKVGDLLIEKCEDEDNSVIVTSKATGDACKVTLDDENMEVEELDSKEFSAAEPFYVIGVHPYDHFIVDAQALTEEAAQVLVERLQENGIEAIQVFQDAEEARDYAFSLLHTVGAKPEEGMVEEPELQKEFSDAVIYTSNYNTNDTVLMTRMFSEEEMGISETRNAIEEALGEPEAFETENGVKITPLDGTSVIIEENGEFTKATICGEDMILEKLDSEEYEEEMERFFSKGIYTNEAQTRFFSEKEEFTSYMERLFSEEANECIIEEALEGKVEVENDKEIVTPVDEETVIVRDKENGEITKVTVIDEDRLNVHPISEEEAENLLANVEVNEEEAVCESEDGTKCFSKNEKLTKYMQRVFSEEADEKLIEEAIEKNKQIENDSEIITPVDEKTAVIEDKESGEFTKAVVKEDDIDLSEISEDEADDLLDEKEYSDNDVKKAVEEGSVVETEEEIITPIDENTAIVEDKEDGDFTKVTVEDDEVKEEAISEEEAKEALPEEAKEEEDKKEEKEDTLSKFFADVVNPAVAQAPVVAQPVQQVPIPMMGAQAPVAEAAPVAVEEAEEEKKEPAISVEAIEDKAMAAVQSIKVAAEEAASQIMEAKAAPVPDAEPEIQEAQFSQKTFSQADDILVSWLSNK